VSKQDSKFFNIFSLVLGILIVITVVLFAMARSVGDNTQKTHLLSDPKYVAAVEGRVGEAEVAVVGQDNSALAIAPAAGVGPLVAVALPADGPAVYETVCGACHMNGIAGAPRSDDKAAWAPRIAQGTTTLYKHAIEGYQGKGGGYMPPKGGRVDLTDELVQAAVDHMIAKAQ
jgi:cytochrome c5